MIKQDVLNLLEEKGADDAQDLRKRSASMSGTEIIDEEEKIPAWSHDKDYTGWTAGSPVSDEGQVWTLIQPHNASYYAGRPSTLRALWGLCHTKNPEKAKPFVEPLGTSGMYMKDECCTDPNAGDPTAVYRSKVDNNVYAPSAYAANWEVVQ